MLKRLIRCGLVAALLTGLSACAGYGLVSQSGGYCTGLADVSCASGTYCKLSTGQCTVAEAGGVCTTPPSSCPDNNAPVCGCNGVTYRNACEASQAQQSVAYSGGCIQRGQPQN